MVNKLEAFAIFVKFHAFVSTQFNASIKCFQSDDGTEFMSQMFSDFLANRGIKHMVSCSYTLQQNGFVKKKHRHVVETAITLMAEANLAPKFWYHACAHETLLINRMPCKVLKMKSPYQCFFFGKVPEVNHFKKFGTAVYPFLRPFNANKLQFRSTQRVFLGYAARYKRVICYNEQNEELILFRHVIHDETVYPCKKKHVSEANGMSHSQCSRQHIVMVQFPIPSVNDVSISHYGNSQEAKVVIVPDDQLQSSSYSYDSSKMQDFSENEIPHHHHHSIPDSTISPLVHVHHNSQLEVNLCGKFSFKSSHDNMIEEWGN
ncbi:hypothetical protein ACFX14_001091 [Malus domestica]